LNSLLNSQVKFGTVHSQVCQKSIHKSSPSVWYTVSDQKLEVGKAWE